MHIYICHKYLTTPRQLEVSRLNRAIILKQSLFPDTGNTTLCCRKPQSAWLAGTAARKATSHREASGHHVLLTPGAKSLLFLVSHPWPIPVAEGAVQGARATGSSRVPLVLAPQCKMHQLA